MTTAAISGHTGSVVMTGGSPAEVVEWRMGRGLKALEAVSMDSAGNEEFVVGLRGATGSFKTRKYFATPVTATVATFKTATAAAANAPWYSCTIIITSDPVECMVNGTIGYSFDFSVTGGVSVATA